MNSAPGVACPTCLHFACVCAIRAKHRAGCAYRRAATLAVPIACAAHGRDVCRVCDRCTCPAGNAPGDFGEVTR